MLIVLILFVSDMPIKARGIGPLLFNKIFSFLYNISKAGDLSTLGYLLNCDITQLENQKYISIHMYRIIINLLVK